MSSILPNVVVITSKCKGKYLKGISKEESTEKVLPQTFLNFLGDDITSLYIKFQVEISNKNSELVHIKCCHNGKYLSLDDSSFIQATAEKPIEDDGRTSTMFKPIRATEFGNGYYFRFVHHGTGRFASLWMAPPPKLTTDNGLCAALKSDIKKDCDVFKVFDWESLVIFPKTAIAFKMSGKNKYLQHHLSNILTSDEYQHFVSRNDSSDKSLANEIINVDDGYVRIKNVELNNYWTFSYEDDGWIYVNKSRATDDDDMLFWPIKLADNVVALQSKAYKRFCVSRSDYNVTDCLKADEYSITDEVKLEIVENIISKSINGIKYHTDEGKIYNLNVIQKGYASADNYEKEESTINLKFSYKKVSSSNLGSSHSFKFGGKVSLKVNWILYIAQSGYEFSPEYTYVRQWGETTTIETLLEATYTGIVPGRKRVKVTLVATEGMCDVPFSYTRRDTLYNGEVIVRNMDDGIYKGVNMFNFDFRCEYEDLPLQQNHKIEELSLDQSTNPSINV